MGIKISVKTKIRCNGQEYDSVEAMPPELRRAYEEAMAQLKETGGSPPPGEKKLIVNRQVCNSLDELPPEIRQTCQEALGTAPGGSDAGGMGVGVRVVLVAATVALLAAFLTWMIVHH
jgi:hypothetical protein